MSGVSDFPALDLMSSLRDQGGSAQLCSEGIQITVVHTALLMYWGSIGKWGMRVGTIGESWGKLGKIGWNRKWIGGDTKRIGSRGMGS